MTKFPFQRDKYQDLQKKELVQANKFGVGVNGDSSTVNLDRDLNIRDTRIDIDGTHNRSGLRGNITRLTTFLTYALGMRDYIVEVDNVALSRTINLPSASRAGIGRMYIIKDISGSALTTTIAVTPQTGELINGDTGSSVNTNYGSLRLFCDGSNWFTF